MPKAQQLGRYHLLDRIAFGGMAEIFRAKTFDQGGRSHLVAVKRVLAHLVEDEEFLQMLIDEARLSASLRHENVVRLYEFARAGGEYFLAMEYVDGKDLRALMERARQQGRPIPPEHVAWAAMETARGLAAAHHQRGPDGEPLSIVHRDVSPSNILCSYRGDVKLCDFGIAKATLTKIQTRAGIIKGKVKYMSPEQALGKRLDHRSDLFSLGTVMYEVLALQAPFQAATEVDLILAVREGRKRPIQELRPDLPEDLVAVIERAMEKSRDARYQDGGEMADELRAFLDAYRPGYRKAHFAHYLRRLFVQEIEREQKLVDGYAIEPTDAPLGENLIADALEHDAPYSKFTPILGNAALGGRVVPPARATRPTAPLRAAAPTRGRDSDLHAQARALLAETGRDDHQGDLHDEQPRPADRARVAAGMHEESTRILDRASVGLTEESTRILDRRAVGLTEESTRILDRASVGLTEESTRILDRASVGLTEESTRILDRRAVGLPEAEVPRGAPRRAHRGADFHEQPTIIVDRDLEDRDLAAGLHEEATRIRPHPQPGLHEASTRIVDRASVGLHEEATQIRERPTGPDDHGRARRAPTPAFQEEVTGERSVIVSHEDLLEGLHEHYPDERVNEAQIEDDQPADEPVGEDTRPRLDLPDDPDDDLELLELDEGDLEETE